MKNNTETSGKRGPLPYFRSRSRSVRSDFFGTSESLSDMKMSLVSVYVAVGAISFVNCEFGFNSLAAWYPAGEARDSEKFVTEVTERKPETAVDGSDMKRVLFDGFRGIVNIFTECQTRVNKRLKKLIKGKVNSRMPELKIYVLSLYQCVKVYGFRSFDEMLQEDFIPVTDFVYFVKDGVNVTEDVRRGRSAGSGLPMKEYAARVLGEEWTTLLYDRLGELLRTHSLKVQLGKSLVLQGRGRRRDHRMFAMMVMGFMIMASILIPMGFQFLTVLGGKSLLLAKLALIMSAINGLKKIATSNVGYGFYHTGSDGHHHDHVHHGFHEKHYNPQNYNLQGYN